MPAHSPKKWTKKSIKEMQAALSTFWLLNRPLSYSAREHDAARSEVLQAIAQHRTEIVIDGITQLASLVESRRLEYQSAADHFRAHPEVYGNHTPEMIARFTNLALAEQRGVEQASKLVTKIRLEGLPPEVVNFDPTNPEGSTRHA